MRNKPKYPDVHVELSGQDGSAYAIIGRTRRELRKAKVEDDVIERFTAEAMSGDYDHVLRTVMKWVSTS